MSNLYVIFNFSVIEEGYHNSDLYDGMSWKQNLYDSIISYSKSSVGPIKCRVQKQVLCGMNIKFTLIAYDICGHYFLAFHEVVKCFKIINKIMMLYVTICLT